MSDEIPDTVERFLERFRQAWDAGDARAFAAQFTEDATYVIFLGEALIGREEIEKNHVDVFGRWQKGTKMAIKAVRVRPLGPNTCSVLTVGGIGRGTPLAYDKFQTFALVRAGRQRECASFQNTTMNEHAKSLYNDSETPPESR